MRISEKLIDLDTLIVIVSAVEVYNVCWRWFEWCGGLVCLKKKEEEPKEKKEKCFVVGMWKRAVIGWGGKAWLDLNEVKSIERFGLFFHENGLHFHRIALVPPTLF
jgi:hypothetical protein